MNKIVLISPHQPRSANILRTASGVTQPLSIAYIASFLETNGYSVEIIDNDIENLRVEEISLKVTREKPLFVGITITSSSTNTSIAIAKSIKEKNKEIVIIAGGIQATTLPEVILNSGYFDFCVIGEGEVTTLEIASRLKNKQDLYGVKGIAYLTNGRITFTEPRELIADLDEIPFPAYHLIPMKKYTLPASRRLTNYPVGSIITSRGCPYKCKFCSHNIVFKNKVRFRSPDNVIKEMLYLRKKFNVREFVFWDDSILLNKERAKEIFKNIKFYLPDIVYTCSSRVDHIDNDLASLMYKSGCRMILFGAESGSQEILDSIGKQTTLERIKEAVEICKRNSIMSFCSFIIGTPGETEYTINQTRNFVLKLNPDFAIFTIFTPLPGSKYFEELLSEGKIDIRNINWDDCINLLSSNPPMIPVEFNLPKSKLIYYQKKLFKDFYFRPSYIFRRLLMLKNLQILLQTMRGLLAIVKLQLKRFKL